MKKILALMIAGVLFVTSSVCVFAQEGTTETITEDEELVGSASKDAEAIKKEVEALKEKIEEQNKQMEEQTKKIEALINQVQASIKSNSTPAQTTQRSSAGRTPTNSGTSDVRTQSLIRNNAVSYGSNVVAQGGHVEINGGKSNVTFLVGVPDNATMNSAASLATNLGGSLINCITVSSQVAFRNAKVNFYITGVNIGDNIAVYQVQNGQWVQLQTAEIRKDHVVVNMSNTGTIAFMRVPVLASATH